MRSLIDPGGEQLGRVLRRALRLWCPSCGQAGAVLMFRFVQVSLLRPWKRTTARSGDVASHTAGRLLAKP